MHKVLYAFVIVTGILTAIVAIFPDAIFLGLIFFIVPGLILSAAPTLFLISATLLIGSIALRQHGRLISYLVPALLFAAVGVALPIYWNWPLNAEMRWLSEGERALNGHQIAAKTLALLTPDTSSWSRIKATDCTEICQRLLFNGSVQAILLGPSTRGFAAPSFGSDNRVMRYRIERRSSCPPVNVPDAGRWDDEPIPGPYSHGTIISDRVKARIAAGECLIAEPADITTADIIIVDQPIKDGDHPYSHPWRVDLDTLTARRLSVHERKDGSLQEVFRQTTLVAQPIFMFLAIVPLSQCSSGACSTKLGIGRRTFKTGEYDLRKFFKTTIGLNVAPVDGTTSVATAALLREALADPTLAADSPRLKVVDGFLRTFSEKGVQGDEDVALLRQIILDRRISSFFYLSSAIRKLGAASAELGGVMLERLAASELPRESDVVQQLSSAIMALPPKALVSVMPQLRAVAENKRLRGKAWRAMIRVSDDGAASVPMLLSFIDAAEEIKKNAHDPERDLLISALIGLCRLGEEGVAAGPRLVGMVRERSQQPYPDPRTNLAIRALVRMGLEQEVEVLYRENENGKKFVSREITNVKKMPAEKICNY